MMYWNGIASAAAELAARLGVSAADIPAVEAMEKAPYNMGGFKLWDVSDKSKPKLISFQKTHGIGVHREDAMHQVGSAVHQRLHQAVIVRTTPLDHVAGQGPGAARETN